MYRYTTYCLLPQIHELREVVRKVLLQKIPRIIRQKQTVLFSANLIKTFILKIVTPLLLSQKRLDAFSKELNIPLFTPLRDFFFEGPSIVLLEDGPTSEQSSVLFFDELAEYTRCQQVHVVVAVDLLFFWKHFDHQDPLCPRIWSQFFSPPRLQNES